MPTAIFYLQLNEWKGTGLHKSLNKLPTLKKNILLEL